MSRFLITHLYNEPELTPFFLRHHIPLFDHCYVIDQGCDDNTMDIVRFFGGDWVTIVPSSMPDQFHAPELDKEVMRLENDIDNKYPGSWKCALNVTETIFHSPDDFADLLEANSKVTGQVTMTSIMMVDPLADAHQPVDDDLPLHAQRFHGYVDYAGTYRSGRSIHCEPDGAYSIGRHHPPTNSGLYVHWWGWSPMVLQWRRKAQIGHRIPDHHRNIYGPHHVLYTQPGALESEFQKFQWAADDLRRDPTYDLLLRNIGVTP